MPETPREKFARALSNAAKPNAAVSPKAPSPPQGIPAETKLAVATSISREASARAGFQG